MALNKSLLTFLWLAKLVTELELLTPKVKGDDKPLLSSNVNWIRPCFYPLNVKYSIITGFFGQMSFFWAWHRCWHFLLKNAQFFIYLLISVSFALQTSYADIAKVPEPPVEKRIAPLIPNLKNQYSHGRGHGHGQGQGGNASQGHGHGHPSRLSAEPRAAQLISPPGNRHQRSKRNQSHNQPVTNY